MAKDLAQRWRVEGDLHDLTVKFAIRNGMFYQRHEDAFALGIPDAYIGAQYRGRVWLEYKITRAGEMPDYRKGQLAWALKAMATREIDVTLAGGLDGLLRLYDTAEMALAAGLGRGVPLPFAAVHRVGTAIEAALAYAVSKQAVAA